MLSDDLFFPFITFEKADDGGGSAGDGEGEGDDGGSGSQPGENLESIEDYKSALKEARDDAYDNRQKRRQLEGRIEKLEGLEEKFDKFKSVFGEEQELDPEKLKSEKESLSSQLQTERVKNSVTLQAISAGADPDLTIAYLQSQGKLGDLEADDSEKVAEEIEAAIKAKPALKVNKGDKVGSGGSETNDDKPLNPIDSFRQAKGIFSNSK